MDSLQAWKYINWYKSGPSFRLIAAKIEACTYNLSGDLPET